MIKRDRKNICVLIAKRLISKSKIKVDYKVIFQAMLLGEGFQEKIRAIDKTRIVKRIVRIVRIVDE